MKLNIWQTSLLIAIASYIVCILAQTLPFGVPITPWPAELVSQIELVAFISGVVGVYLMVVESTLNYPVGLIWAVAYGWYFFTNRHFGEATTMLISAGYLIDGWIKWSRSEPALTTDKASQTLETLSPPPSALPITHLNKTHWGVIAITLAIVIPLLIWLLTEVHGAYVYWDAATTALGLTAQYLTNRKVFQSWYFWIAANLVIVPVFIYRQWYPTAILYTIFTVMAFIGIKQWRESMRAEQARRDTPLTPYPR